jgi:pyruvate dehydrogenase E1 component beta subunit
MKSNYHKAICEEMQEFAKDPKVIFLGQQVLSEDFYDTLLDIPGHARREMPVAEDMQMGISIGMALEGYLPISIYQRMDFLPRAMDQLVNHLNLIKPLSRNLYCPKVIIRTTIGTKKPLDVGLQHSGDLTRVMQRACHFPVLLVTTPEEVHKAYKLARKKDSPIMVVEKQELY